MEPRRMNRLPQKVVGVQRRLPRRDAHHWKNGRPFQNHHRLSPGHHEHERVAEFTLRRSVGERRTLRTQPTRKSSFKHNAAASTIIATGGQSDPAMGNDPIDLKGAAVVPSSFVSEIDICLRIGLTQRCRLKVITRADTNIQRHQTTVR